jgi:AraC-like DNA-binding protein
MHTSLRAIPAAILDIAHCIQNCAFKGRARKAYLLLKVHELLLSVLALYEEGTAKSANLSGEMLAKMQNVQSFLEMNYTSHFTIAELAKMFALNTTTLKSNFQSVAGIGLYAFVLSRRMSKAKELLEPSDLTITAIAYQLGYKSAGTFIRAFKKHFGYTPGHGHT